MKEYKRTNRPCPECGQMLYIWVLHPEGGLGLPENAVGIQMSCEKCGHKEVLAPDLLHLVGNGKE